MLSANRYLVDALSDYGNSSIKEKSLEHRSLHQDIQKHSKIESASGIEKELLNSGVMTVPYDNLVPLDRCFQVQRTPTRSVLVRFAPPCCADLIGLTLANNDQIIDDQDVIKEISPSLQRNIDVLIFGLDINCSILKKRIGHEIQMFDDECVCISSILSVNSKLIYLVLSATVSELVIPLIHNHRCLEQIYILGSDPKAAWIQDYSKVRGTCSSIDQIAEELMRDVEALMKRPSRWLRTRDLFAELSTQTIQNESNIMPYIFNINRRDLHTLSIVTLYYDDCRSFQFYNDQMNIYEFSDIKDCSDFIISNQKPSSIFLIISTNAPFDIKSLIELSAVHAVYIVSDTMPYNLLETVSSSKISGMFSQYDDLLIQLLVDICFYRQMAFHIPKMSLCTTHSNIFVQPGKHRIEFLRLQLFIDIVKDLAFLSDDHFALVPYYENNQLLCLPVNKIETSVIINQIFKQSDFFLLLKSSLQLSHIERLLESISTKTSMSSVAFYRAQLVSEEYLQMMQDGPNFLFKIHTLITASRSFQTISTICRRAVDNGLTVAMFEIIISEKTSLSHLDSNIAIFRLGTVFRLVSIDLKPDGIYHIQLKPDDDAMQNIKAQIQAEIGEHLTWLTCGNCLTALKQFDAAKDYYHFILKFLPGGHPSNAAVCNNMGLMYSTMNEDFKASELFNIARRLVIIGTWTLSGTDQQEKTEAELLQSQANERALVKSKIAEIRTYLKHLINVHDFESKYELI